MDFEFSDDQIAIRSAVGELCDQFPESYWIDKDSKFEYPKEFVDALTEAGWLGILIPEEYGGGGLGAIEGALVLETINRSGGSAQAAHAQMYTMGTLLRHGSDAQKKQYLPAIAKGDLRLQAFGVTEPDAGSDTTRITTRAVRDGDQYVITGRKVFISRVVHSDLMILLARTTPYGEVARKHEGISVFLVDLQSAGKGIDVKLIPTIVNHQTYEVVFDELRIPAANLIGEAGKGFKYILSGMNIERVLVCSEHLGNGFWFVTKAAEYAGVREVFGRPIGQNQGVQFPLANAYAQLEAASLMRWKAAAAFDAGRPAGEEANMAKLLASEAAWAAANAAMDTFGGYGLTEEYGVGRKVAAARLSLVAPISNNVVRAFIAHKILGMPKSY